MAYQFAAWYPAETCTDGPGDGAKALMAYVLENFPEASNWGIYNCRTVRGGSTTSPHGEGRACDFGMPMTSSGRGSAAGKRLVDALGRAGKDLGIQAIIYDRTIWSAKSPGGRRYNGASPHYDHVHVEMTRSAARSVTLATVRRVMGDGSGSSGSKYEDYKKGVPAGSRTIGMFETRPRSAGDDVKELQRILNAWYPQKARLKRDGYFGPKTKARVEYMQRRANIAVDGICGPVTWGKLNVI